MGSPTWIVRQRIRSKYGLEYTYCSGTISFYILLAHGYSFCCLFLGILD